MEMTSNTILITGGGSGSCKKIGRRGKCAVASATRKASGYAEQSAAVALVTRRARLCARTLRHRGLLSEN
jgi:short-subunit dehydrogenase involved in D-alanine esterification of teichoic acids